MESSQLCGFMHTTAGRPAPRTHPLVPCAVVAEAEGIHHHLAVVGLGIVAGRVFQLLLDGGIVLQVAVRDQPLLHTHTHTLWVPEPDAAPAWPGLQHTLRSPGLPSWRASLGQDSWLHAARAWAAYPVSSPPPPRPAPRCMAPALPPAAAGWRRP